MTEESKERIKEIVERLKITDPKVWLKFIDLNRRIYNNLCRPCQVLTMRTGGNLKPSEYCKTCEPMAVKYLEKIKKLLEENKC